MKQKLILIALVFSLLSLTACTEYWWTRGQPPKPAKLYTRALDTLKDVKSKNTYNRSSIVTISSNIEKSLNSLIAETNQGQNTRNSYASLKTNFMALESKLSSGSRPAYGELSGQLRLLAKSENVSASTLELFAARTIFFLASEISVPAPNAPRV